MDKRIYILNALRVYNAWNGYLKASHMLSVIGRQNIYNISELLTQRLGANRKKLILSTIIHTVITMAFSAYSLNRLSSAKDEIGLLKQT